MLKSCLIIGAKYFILK